MNKYSKFLDKKIFYIVSKCADKLNYETYVVGGWVRDLLMGRIKKNTDIDFVCVGSGIKLAEEVQKETKPQAKEKPKVDKNSFDAKIKDYTKIEGRNYFPPHHQVPLSQISPKSFKDGTGYQHLET